jgi:long-chain fatty acid transport protein
VIAALVATCGVAHASAPDLFGMGPRPAALAGGGVADGDGWDQTYTNPAGLADARRRQLSLGYLGARYLVRLDGAARDITPTNGVLLGAVLPIPFGGILRDRVGLGLAFHLPTEFVTRARAPFPGTPRLPLLDDRTQVVSVAVSAGVRVHRRVELGVGVLALAALVGQIVISTDASGHATTLSNEELVTRLSPVVGLRVRATDRLRLGLVYRGESTAEYDVRILTKLSGLSDTIPTLLLRGVAQYDPHQLHLEAALAFGQATLFLGLAWKHWSGYPIPSENATPGTPAQPSPGLHDTVVPRLALEMRHGFARGVAVLRAGYAYELSPADAHTNTPYLDADRHVLGCGGGISWVRGRAGLHLDLFEQWQHLARAVRVGGDAIAFGATLGIDL